LFYIGRQKGEISWRFETATETTNRPISNTEQPPYRALALLLSMKNGLERLIDELHSAILNWRTHYTKKKLKNNEKITKDIKVTVLAQGRVMVNLY